MCFDIVKLLPEVRFYMGNLNSTGVLSTRMKPNHTAHSGMYLEVIATVKEQLVGGTADISRPFLKDKKQP